MFDGGRVRTVVSFNFSGILEVHHPGRDLEVMGLETAYLYKRRPQLSFENRHDVVRRIQYPGRMGKENGEDEYGRPERYCLFSVGKAPTLCPVQYGWSIAPFPSSCFSVSS